MVPRGRLEVAGAVLADFLGGAARRAGSADGEGDGDGKCLTCGAEMGDEPVWRACGWTFYGKPGDPAE